MPFPIGRLIPPEPPEKWRTIRDALDSEDKTRRLCRIIRAYSIPLVLIAALAVVAAFYIRLRRTDAPTAWSRLRSVIDVLAYWYLTVLVGELCVLPASLRWL